jgi:chaperonin GroES
MSSGLNLAKRLKPLFDRVLVQRVEAVKKIGSVYIPDSAMEKINEGVVIAVGPGARNQAGETIKMTVKEGDKVLLPEYGGDKIEMDKQEFTIFREAELLGVLADK